MLTQQLKDQNNHKQNEEKKAHTFKQKSELVTFIIALSNNFIPSSEIQLSNCASVLQNDFYESSQK